MCNPSAVWWLAKRLSGYFHHFLNKIGVLVMLSLCDCLAARAKKSEVFLTNYASRVGVVTSKSAHLIIRLPPISGYLTAKTNCLELHVHRLYKRVLFVRANMKKYIKTLGCHYYMCISWEMPHWLKEGRAASTLSPIFVSYWFSVWHVPFGGGNQNCQLLLVIALFFSQHLFKML